MYPNNTPSNPNNTPTGQTPNNPPGASVQLPGIANQGYINPVQVAANQQIETWDKYAITIPANLLQFEDIRTTIDRHYSNQILQGSKTLKMFYLFKIPQSAYMVNTYGEINGEHIERYEQYAKSSNNQNNTLILASEFNAGTDNFRKGIHYFIIHAYGPYQIDDQALTMHGCRLLHDGRLVFGLPNRGYDRAMDGRVYDNEAQRTSFVACASINDIKIVLNHHDYYTPSPNQQYHLMPEPLPFERARQIYWELTALYKTYQERASTMNIDNLTQLIATFTEKSKPYQQQIDYLTATQFNQTNAGGIYYQELTVWQQEINNCISQLRTAVNTLQLKQQYAQQANQANAASPAAVPQPQPYGRVINQGTPEQTSEEKELRELHTVDLTEQEAKPENRTVPSLAHAMSKLGFNSRTAITNTSPQPHPEGDYQPHPTNSNAHWVIFIQKTDAEKLAEHLNKHLQKGSKPFSAEAVRGVISKNGNFLVKGLNTEVLVDVAKQHPELLPQAAVTAAEQLQSTTSKTFSFGKLFN